MLRQEHADTRHRRYHDEPGDRLGRIGRVRHTWIDNEDEKIKRRQNVTRTNYDKLRNN